MADRKTRLVRTGFAAVMGLAFGVMAAAKLVPAPPVRASYFPQPYHVPKYPGGVSFRFAMVHDVLHERYPKHGPAHYRERNRLTREKLAAHKFKLDSPETFPLADDLAAGLARLGRLAEAVDLLRTKLARQEARGLTGRDLYTTYANLGAILVHVRFDEAIAGDPAAREAFREGVGLIKKAVEVNPEAHFGREAWQVAYAEFVLAAMDGPKVLTETDFIGNRLKATPDEFGWKDHYADSGYGRAYTWDYSRGRAFERRTVSDLSGRFEEPAVWESVKEYRNSITKVGGELGPTVGSKPREPAPFDEPCLGIVGMWRQGIGPDPHFALCLGEIMVRVGQRYIAWAAFERASRMADRFWPTPETRQFLRDHCAKRQREVEATLTAGEVAELRPRFDAELAYGEKYQREYQQYEADKIAAGVSIFDEHFYDGFNAGREPIASPSGPEEWFATLDGPFQEFMDRAKRTVSLIGWGLLGAGLLAAATAWVYRPRAALAPAAPGR